jgi:hypothetical protein
MVRKVLTLSAVLVATAALYALVTSCATVRVNPTETEIQQTQALATRIADAVAVAATIADSGGALANTLPIPGARKNRIDCAILRATGPTMSATPAQTAAVTAACGAAIETGILRRVLAELPGITAKPALLNTVARALSAIDPLLAALEGSDQAALRTLAAVLRTATMLLRGITAAPIADAGAPRGRARPGRTLGTQAAPVCEFVAGWRVLGATV